MKVVVYGLQSCPKCDRLKAYLTDKGIPFSDRDMQDVKSRSILMAMNVFTRDAPVLDADGSYLTPEFLFSGNVLDTDLIDDMLGLNAGLE